MEIAGRLRKFYFGTRYNEDDAAGCGRQISNLKKSPIMLATVGGKLKGPHRQLVHIKFFTD